MCVCVHFCLYTRNIKAALTFAKLRFRGPRRKNVTGKFEKTSDSFRYRYVMYFRYIFQNSNNHFHISDHKKIYRL